MNNYRNIESLRTTALYLTREGWFKPVFTLTDGQFDYGKITQTGFWKPVITLESAQNIWFIKRKGAFKRSLIINDINDMEVGSVVPELFSSKIKLSLNNGFEATYLNKKIFKRTFSLIHDQYGDILDIKTALWSVKKPFDISINLDLIKTIPDIPLLALLGIKLIMIKQAQAHASAGVPV